MFAAPMQSVTTIPPEALIAMALITMVGTVVSAYFAAGSRKHSREVNDAVNHRHLRGVDADGQPTHPRLYDSVIDMSAQMTHVVGTIGELRADQHKIRADLTETKTQVEEIKTDVGAVTTSLSDLDKAFRTHATHTAHTARIDPQFQAPVAGE